MIFWLSDWVTIAPDHSRPVITRDANDTEIVSYPYTKNLTTYANDSSIDLYPDSWGNLIVSVNDADIVVIPRPFATDATGKRFELDFKLDKINRIISITGDLNDAIYTITIDPSERVTNGGFEIGTLDGGVRLAGYPSSFTVVPGDEAFPPYQGSYYLDVVGTDPYSVLRQEYVYYDGVTSVSCAAAIPVPNKFDIAVSNVWLTYGNRNINIPGQAPQGWTIRSTSPTLNGYSTIDIWTYSETHGHIDSITTVPPAPVANFTALPATGYKPLTVRFTDTSTGSPTSWSWDFGDGRTSGDQNPQHTYVNTGSYTVRLTVMNAGGSNLIEKTGLVVVVKGPAYSMTDTAYREDKNAPKGQLMDTAVDNCDNMKARRDSLGWEMILYNQGPGVTKADFGVNPEPGQVTLNSAILHFHTGHGSPKDNNGHTTLALLDQNNYPYSLYASEVQGKWGGNNKWVVLDSCYAMLYDDWGRALTTSHGIMGSKTQVETPPKFTQQLLNYSIDYEKTVYVAYIKTTFDLLKDQRVPKNPGDTEKTEKVVAAVVFKDQNQAKYDYLPGVKKGIYFGPNSGEFHRKDWPCDNPPAGV